MAAILNVFITSENNSTELRLAKALTIEGVKGKLEAITGISPKFQQLELYHDKTFVTSMEENQQAMLGSFPIEEYWTIHVIDTNPHKVRGAFNDVSLVEKFELGDTEYEKLTDTVLAFKRRNKLGRFNDSASTDTANSQEREEKLQEEQASKIQLGDRCEVSGGGGRRGTVRFIGRTEFQQGIWIGIEYDEPVGLNDGSVQGKRYFKCGNKFGGFVKPEKVTVGEFKKDEDLFSDEEDI